MSLIKCPECGNRISDKAIICPHCGIEAQKELAQILEQKRQKKKSRRKKAIVTIVLTFVVASIGVVAYLSSIDALNTIPKEERQQSEEYFKVCESAIYRGDFQEGCHYLEILKCRYLTKRQTMRLRTAENALVELGLAELERYVGIVENDPKTQADIVLKKTESILVKLKKCQLDPTQSERLNMAKNIITGDLVFEVEGVSFVMKFIEGGTFQMGSDGFDAGDDENPIHDVTVNSFYMCETEVTQALWMAVMEVAVGQQRDRVDHSKPLRGVGDNYPMYYVGWYDCQGFIYKLNQYTGKRFRLPTEAEWEYAARGGALGNGFEYSGGESLRSVGWYSENSNDSSHLVKTKSPNALGLYDMSGNVWEWCQDWYGGYYKVSEVSPQGPLNGSKRVVRGGSWYSQSSFCRVSKRHKLDPNYRDTCYGLRLVMEP